MQIVQVFSVRVAIGLRCKAKLAIDQTNVTTDKKWIGLLQKTDVIGDHIEGMFGSIFISTQIVQLFILKKARFAFCQLLIGCCHTPYTALSEK